MRKFWLKSYKEDADSTSCGKKTIYLQDFHRTCVFSTEFEWDLNESTGEVSQGQCVLMIAAPGSKSYKVISFGPKCGIRDFHGSRIACLYIEQRVPEQSFRSHFPGQK